MVEEQNCQELCCYHSSTETDKINGAKCIVLLKCMGIDVIHLLPKPDERYTPDIYNYEQHLSNYYFQLNTADRVVSTNDKNYEDKLLW